MRRTTAAGLVFVVGLMACSPPAASSHRPARLVDTTPAPTSVTAVVAPAQTAESPSPVPSASGRFGFSRVHESCNSFSAHITNPARDAWLDVYVDVARLALGPGKHELAIDGEAVRLEVSELAGAHDGEWSCTDVGGGPLSKVIRRWKAREGTLEVNLHLPAPDTPDPPYDGPYDRVDIALRDVRFFDGAGHERRVTVAFDALRIGWMPG